MTCIVCTYKAFIHILYFLFLSSAKHLLPKHLMFFFMFYVLSVELHFSYSFFSPIFISFTEIYWNYWKRKFIRNFSDKLHSADLGAALRLWASFVFKFSSVKTNFQIKLQNNKPNDYAYHTFRLPLAPQSKHLKRKMHVLYNYYY